MITETVSRPLQTRAVRKTRSQEISRALPQRPTIRTTMTSTRTQCVAHAWISPQDPRPLPSPPTPTAGPLSAPVRMKVIRPLPSPPTSNPEVRVIPASPMPPPTPAPQPSFAFLSLPPPNTKKPDLYASLSLQTSPDFLRPPTSNESEEAISPLSPSIPLTPTPSVARKKRMSKLRRHLGESVTESMLCEDRQGKFTVLDEKPPDSSDNSETTHNLSGIIFTKSEYTYDDASLTSDDDEEDGSLYVHSRKTEYGYTSDGDRFQFTPSFRATSFRRQSKRWIREKGGHRWEEQDYSDVLRTLRSL